MGGSKTQISVGSHLRRDKRGVKWANEAVVRDKGTADAGVLRAAVAGTSLPGPCPRAEPGSLQRRALGAPGLSRALTQLPRGAAAPSRKGLRCRGARTGRPHRPSPGHGASTSTQCPLVGTISLPGDTRLPRKRDVPLLGAVPGMLSVLRAPGETERQGGRGVRAAPTRVLMSPANGEGTRLAPAPAHVPLPWGCLSPILPSHSLPPS